MVVVVLGRHAEYANCPQLKRTHSLVERVQKRQTVLALPWQHDLRLKGVFMRGSLEPVLRNAGLLAVETEYERPGRHRRVALKPGELGIPMLRLTGDRRLVLDVCLQLLAPGG
ncbi:hypothetical protein CAI21_18725 [Alkalilimnicola ehrlichii]|nr:hypothetical protein CAI21_18725 [Alkalilimnicola ehrlichii]